MSNGVPLPEEHDHDEEGNCLVPEGMFQPVELPAWRFSIWDVAGIATTTVAGVFSVLGQGSNLLAREFGAMANWARNNYDARQAYEQEVEARREMAAAYQQLVFGDEPGDPT